MAWLEGTTLPRERSYRSRHGLGLHCRQTPPSRSRRQRETYRPPKAGESRNRARNIAFLGRNTWFGIGLPGLLGPVLHGAAGAVLCPYGPGIRDPVCRYVPLRGECAGARAARWHWTTSRHRFPALSQSRSQKSRRVQTSRNLGT